MWVASFVKTGVIAPYPVSERALMELVATILGIAAFRTYEKIKKVDKPLNGNRHV
jgi:hypothetical protein